MPESEQTKRLVRHDDANTRPDIEYELRTLSCRLDALEHLSPPAELCPVCHKNPATALGTACSDCFEKSRCAFPDQTTGAAVGLNDKTDSAESVPEGPSAVSDGRVSIVAGYCARCGRCAPFAHLKKSDKWHCVDCQNPQPAVSSTDAEMEEEWKKIATAICVEAWRTTWLPGDRDALVEAIRRAAPLIAAAIAAPKDSE